ncbi:NADH-quinone oxidoreductase subunit NuoK [soil metagenome]
MTVAFPLVFASLLFSVGVYGVLSRRNAVLVLMSVELMLGSTTINLAVFSQVVGDPQLAGQAFALFVIALGAAEVGVGLAIILLLYRNRASINVDDADLMKY